MITFISRIKLYKAYFTKTQEYARLLNVLKKLIPTALLRHILVDFLEGCNSRNILHFVVYNCRIDLFGSVQSGLRLFTQSGEDASGT